MGSFKHETAEVVNLIEDVEPASKSPVIIVIENSPKDKNDTSITKQDEEGVNTSALKVSEPSNTKSKSTYNYKAHSLALRDDVVNKTLLRSIKRFYLNKFKKNHSDLVKARFKNLKVEVLLKALEDFSKEEFPEYKNPELFAEFMMLFLGLKPGNKYKYNEAVASKAGQVIGCMYSYSSKKFRSLRSIKELGLIAFKVYESHLENFISGEKTMMNSKTRYKNAFIDFIDMLN